jgi:hypothetical protein
MEQLHSLNINYNSLKFDFLIVIKVTILLFDANSTLVEK